MSTKDIQNSYGENDVNQKERLDLLEQLYKKFISVIDPGAEDQHLLQCIRVHQSTHNISDYELFNMLHSIVNNTPKYTCMLALLYQYGVGTTRDNFQMYGYYKVAAAHGDLFGMNQLGWCYQQGIYVDQDPEIAFMWYTKSAQFGNTTGQCNLAYCYLDGIGTKICWSKGFYWFLKSAQGGIAVSQYNLARFYRYSMGFNRDLHEAIKWYRRSMMQGDVSWTPELDALLQNVVDMED
ncbi:11614_t:CDS:1 [Ambispora gerdemannii]|uniref:11614_t:CDS:1 n=1 Tax=Ambispora gerdemannii TaxID=144530 RepID=A0A9N8YS48_9GLOM|nr:11614_t:CDS:1 [Ambispora gerdemannii]